MAKGKRAEKGGRVRCTGGDYHGFNLGGIRRKREKDIH